MWRLTSVIALSHLACQPETNGAFSSLLARHAPSWLGQMPSLSAGRGQPEPQHEASGATRKRMLREMCDAIEALTEQQLLVLSLGQLHWADYATLDLIAELAQRPNPARLLLTGTYRSAAETARRHPRRTGVGAL